MNKSIALTFISLSIISLNSTIYAGLNDDAGSVETRASRPNWKLHIADLEAAVYADSHERATLVSKLDEIKGDGDAPTSNYMGLLWKIAHENNPSTRENLINKLSLLVFAHYVWHAWGFKQKISMEHQAAEKGQKTEWILRRPQEMKMRKEEQRLSVGGELVHIHKIMVDNNRQVHEDFKHKLSEALAPIAQQLQENRGMIPASFSDFWTKLQTKASETYISRLIKADEHPEGDVLPSDASKTKTENTILDEIWNVFDTVWK